MDFETEEQQLEAIKNWWKENSTMIIGGIAVGVAAIFGVNYFQSQSAIRSENASILYEQVLIGAQNPETTADLISTQLAKVNQLEAEFSDTPYATLSALIVARQHMNAGEVAKAEKQYQWVIDNTRQEEMKYLAKIRLARLLSGNKEADRALAILTEAYPESFSAMVLELKGDVLLSQGHRDRAKAAYTQAQLLSSKPGRWLKLKLDDLGGVAKQVAGATEPSA
ncbi:MAG TPA: tetratricopeptide repeat protein [Gammaproteobacteria bacterium]|nr:tetratricopeptide repeat protein [Gammaproteobacteria bacterium]